MRHLAIGDIHGCSTALKALTDLIQPTQDDTIVFLGDYIDRGPDSKGVLDSLLILQHQTNLVALLGNHEMMLLEALESKDARKRWVEGMAGGKATLDSYKAFSVSSIPDQHIRFIKTCVRYHETAHHIFVHANVDPDLDLKAQKDDVLFWSAIQTAPPRHKFGKTMIYGHTPQMSGEPKNWGSAICIDTGAGYGGWLTCLDVNSGRYWQANEEGQKREGLLHESPLAH